MVKAIVVPRGSRLANGALKAKGDVHEQASAAGPAGFTFARVAVAADGSASLDAPRAVKDALAGRQEALARRQPNVPCTPLFSCCAHTAPRPPSSRAPSSPRSARRATTTWCCSRAGAWRT